MLALLMLAAAARAQCPERLPDEYADDARSSGRVFLVPAGLVVLIAIYFNDAVFLRNKCKRRDPVFRNHVSFIFALSVPYLMRPGLYFSRRADIEIKDALAQLLIGKDYGRYLISPADIKARARPIICLLCVARGCYKPQKFTLPRAQGKIKFCLR